MKRLAIILPLIMCILACTRNAEGGHSVTADELFAQQDSVLMGSAAYSDTIAIRYAEGLKVQYTPEGVRVTITNPDARARNERGQELLITKPSSRFICTTALQLGNFEVLGLEDRIVGMNSLKNLFSPRMKEQMADGRTVRIGKEGNFDLETVIALQPDYIFVSASKHGGFEALRDCDIPLIPHHGYKENNPLGQAEWIKLVGLLTGETRRANAVFADIERKYLALRDEVAKTCRDTVTIISGRQMRDGWYVVGGQSYMARIFRDAGARYVLQDNADTGGVSLDFEAVYAKGIHADFWQMDSSFDGDFTLGNLAAEDERYTTMDAYRNGHVLFCNLARTPYRELSGVQPHYLLADFVKAMHPDVLPHYEPKYYMLLK